MNKMNYSTRSSYKRGYHPNICRFDPRNDLTVYGASSDGTISCTDLETGISLSLMNLNPNGWQVFLNLKHFSFQ